MEGVDTQRTEGCAAAAAAAAAAAVPHTVVVVVVDVVRYESECGVVTLDRTFLFCAFGWFVRLESGGRCWGGGGGVSFSLSWREGRLCLRRVGLPSLALGGLLVYCTTLTIVYLVLNGVA
jgi:hypothetical protein